MNQMRHSAPGGHSLAPQLARRQPLTVTSSLSWRQSSLNAWKRLRRSQGGSNISAAAQKKAELEFHDFHQETCEFESSAALQPLRQHRVGDLHDRQGTRSKDPAPAPAGHSRQNSNGSETRYPRGSSPAAPTRRGPSAACCPSPCSQLAPSHVMGRSRQEPTEAAPGPAPGPPAHRQPQLP